MTGLQDASGWKLFDPRPGVPLDEIEPHAVRVRALLARQISHPLMADNFVTVTGAASFVEGMDYHYRRHMQISSRAESGDVENAHEVVHEVVAYMNRLGQFHYFTESDLVRPLVAGVPTPTIDALLPFRMKFSAHRSLDKPRNESPATLEAQALSLGGYFPMWRPKVPGKHWPPPRGAEQWRTHHRVFQIKADDAGNFVDFVMEVQHPLVAAEAYAVFAKLLS